MLRTVSLLWTLTALVACDSQPVGSLGSSLAPEETAALAEDAAVLAFRYQLAVEHDSDTVALPQDLVQNLYQSLVQVRESEHGGLVEGIHTFPVFSTHEISVAADTAVTWTDAWRRGDVVTGFAPIDEPVARYGLALAGYADYPWADSGRLRSDEPVNTVALARQFESVAGVRYAEPGVFGGDGDDVEAVRVEGGWRLDFSRGTGDCLAGCIQRTHWTFRVVGATVEYLGTRDR